MIKTRTAATLAKLLLLLWGFYQYYKTFMKALELLQRKRKSWSTQIVALNQKKIEIGNILPSKLTFQLEEKKSVNLDKNVLSMLHKSNFNLSSIKG